MVIMVRTLECWICHGSLLQAPEGIPWYQTAYFLRYPPVIKHSNWKSPNSTEVYSFNISDIWYMMIYHHIYIWDIYEIWWYMMIYDDIWWYMMIYDDIWWYMMIYDDIWYMRYEVYSFKISKPRLIIGYRRVSLMELAVQWPLLPLANLKPLAKGLPVALTRKY